MTTRVSANADAMIQEHRRDEFLVSTDRAKLNVDVIYTFLTNSYWAKGIPREVVVRSIENSLCFGVYDGSGAQVGFTRVITDFATFAYIADVFVLESHQGRGLGKFLMECIKQHPNLQRLRRWTLSTRDAHGLYAQYGFTPLEWPDRYMEILRQNHYETM